MTLKYHFQQAIQKLTKTSDTPRLDAELLLAHTLQQERSYFYAHHDQELNIDDIKLFNDLIDQRLNDKPIAYITEHKEFWSLNLEVNENVLIPRPETELLVELALQFLPMNDSIKAVDLGTGSGAIALAIAKERPNWHIIATDNSNEALLIAKKNAQRFKLTNVEFKFGDWCHALPDYKFDIIISNPPYIAENDPHLQGSIKFEPQSALIAKNNGLDALNTIIVQAKNKLKANGILILEHGYKQGGAVKNLLLENSYQNITQYCDLAGLERAICAYM